MSKMKMNGLFLRKPFCKKSKSFSKIEKVTQLVSLALVTETIYDLFVLFFIILRSTSTSDKIGREEGQ